MSGLLPHAVLSGRCILSPQPTGFRAVVVGAVVGFVIGLAVVSVVVVGGLGVVGAAAVLIQSI